MGVDEKTPFLTVITCWSNNNDDVIIDKIGYVSHDTGLEMYVIDVINKKCRWYKIIGKSLLLLGDSLNHWIGSKVTID